MHHATVRIGTLDLWVRVKCVNMEVIMRNVLAIVSVTIFAGLAAPAALATDICEAHDEAEWMSEADITAKAKEMGYEVRKVKKEDGCWEVKGMKDGKRVEAYLDPVTAVVVLTK